MMFITIICPLHQPPVLPLSSPWSSLRGEISLSPPLADRAAAELSALLAHLAGTNQ